MWPKHGQPWPGRLTWRGRGSSEVIFAAGVLLVVLTGCQQVSLERVHEIELREEALRGLKAGARYEANAVVRAQAIEALGKVAPGQGTPFFLEALRDPSPVVRFAACMALGSARCKDAAELLRLRLEDEEGSVQAAAVYALHRLGDQGHTSILADKLLRDPDVRVRRNAALILGELGEAGSIRLLKHAARDRDEGVMLQATEAMALLGDPKARQQLAVQAHDGAGHRQALALIAMGRIRDPRFLPAIEYRLKEGPYPETRLAAARALGQYGREDGLKLALKELDFVPSGKGLPEDPPENQIMRIRSMAALALGAIGDPAALPALKRRLEAQDDPRVQLAAARAILEILDSSGPWSARADNSARTAAHRRR
ncbi:MAG: HEAT repeat domain-containing protein [Phycisphaerales bacterium]|nr:MAG: HEAT repeat domain-containing protein [Phycisphaerales bacterium]